MADMTVSRDRVVNSSRLVLWEIGTWGGISTPLNCNQIRKPLGIVTILIVRPCQYPLGLGIPVGALRLQSQKTVTVLMSRCRPVIRIWRRCAVCWEGSISIATTIRIQIIRIKNSPMIPIPIVVLLQLLILVQA